MQTAKNTDMPAALVLAGGRGTRLSSLIRNVPKPMATIAGRPILEHIMLELKRNDIYDVYISVGHLHEVIRGHFGDGTKFGVRVKYINEDAPLGTGGAVKLAFKTIGLGRSKALFVLNGDDVFSMDVPAMYKFHKDVGALATMALKQSDGSNGLGTVTLEKQSGRILSFVEKPADDKHGTMVNIGRYFINGGAIDTFPNTEAFSLEKDFFAALAGGPYLFGYPAEGEWYRNDTPELYSLTNEKFKGTQKA